MNLYLFFLYFCYIFLSFVVVSRLSKNCSFHSHRSSPFISCCMCLCVCVCVVDFVFSRFSSLATLSLLSSSLSSPLRPCCSLARSSSSPRVRVSFPVACAPTTSLPFSTSGWLREPVYRDYRSVLAAGKPQAGSQAGRGYS